MRANAHRRVVSPDGCTAVEVAASPDTPGRSEPWQWHIRLHDGPECTVTGPEDGSPDGASRRVPLEGDGGPTALEVSVDAGAVRPRIDVVEIADTRLIERSERDLLTLLVTAGTCLVEGRHALGAGDAMVLEGEDPVTVSVSATATVPARLAVVLLTPTTAGSLGWVP